MIKNRSLFIFSCLFFLAFIIFNFPFPHAAPIGELLFSSFEWPYNVNIAASIALFLLGLCLVSLVKSLNKFKLRVVLITVFTAFSLPLLTVKAYQQSVAAGIYAVDYDSQASRCQLEKTSDKTMLIQCELTFENYSNSDVQFMLQFVERDDMFQEFLHAIGPIKVKLPPDRSTVQIDEELDISEFKNLIDSGEGTGMAIIIEAEGKLRKL